MSVLMNENKIRKWNFSYVLLTQLNSAYVILAIQSVIPLLPLTPLVGDPEKGNNIKL